MPLRVGGHSPNLGALANKDARWLRPAAVVISAALDSQGNVKTNVKTVGEPQVNRQKLPADWGNTEGGGKSAA